MKIAILGAYGFLGTHLTEYYINKGYNIIKLGKDYDLREVKDCNFLIHCAFIGGSIANTSNIIYEENIEISKTLINKLKKYNINIPIKYISSIYEDDPKSLSGKAKRISKKLLNKYCEENNLKFENYKLPNLFGTKGKPYYNCFVYTFAYNIVNNIKSQYNTNLISLCHVSDAIKVIDNETSSFKLHHSSVDKIYQTLKNLNKNKNPKNLFEEQLYDILKYYKNLS